MSNEIRLCLDLNIWVGALLCYATGKKNTVTQQLRDLVVIGKDIRGRRVDLVISWGMLNRLYDVLVRDSRLSKVLARQHVDANAEIAKYPQLVLGGTGVIPIEDEEDAAVLETAISGRADALVTRNFKDFVVSSDVQILRDGEVARYRYPDRSLLIVQPRTAMAWVNGELF